MVQPGGPDIEKAVFLWKDSLFFLTSTIGDSDYFRWSTAMRNELYVLPGRVRKYDIQNRAFFAHERETVIDTVPWSGASGCTFV